MSRIDYGDISEKEFNNKVESTVKFAEKIIKYAANGKDALGVEKEYEKSIDYYKGNHKVKLRSEKKGNLVWNKYSQAFDHRVSEITDAYLKWKFDPIEENDILTSYPLNVVLGDVVLERTHWNDYKAEEAIIECAHAGSVHLKTLADTQIGMADYVVVPVYSAFPDPLAKKKSQLRFFVHLISKSVSDIERDYGVKVKPEYSLDNKKSQKGYGYYISDEDNPRATTMEFEDDRQDIHGFVEDEIQVKMGMATIAEIWLNDATKEKIPFDPKEVDEEHEMFAKGMYSAVDPEENHLMHLKFHKARLDTLDPIANEEEYNLLNEHINAHLKYDVKEYRNKYPRGRIITVCQGKLLRDEPNPLPIDWHDVFIKIDWYKIPNQYWGKNFGHDIIDPQDALNHRKNAITQNINNLNNGIVRVKTQLFEKLFGRGNKKKIKNIDGYAIPMNNMDDLIRDFGPQLPSHVLADLYHTEGFIDSRENMQGVGVGIYPKGSPPDATVQRLLEQGQKPMKTVLNHYASALKLMAKNAIKIMYEFMPEEFYFRVVGEDKKAQNIQWSTLKNGGILDIKISVEPTLATTRQMIFNKAMALREAGVYTDKAVLEAIDDPLKYEVMQEKNIVMQLNATVQQLLSELDKKDKEINTMMNRIQGKLGEGNVGKTKTSG